MRKAHSARLSPNARIPTVERLDKRTIQRVSGPAWDGIRPLFERVSDVLLSVCPTATGELTTIYIKYISADTGGRPYAVVWIRKSTELTVGLALPDGFTSPELQPAPPRYSYSGLTGYFKLAPADEPPAKLEQWAQVAFENLKV